MARLPNTKALNLAVARMHHRKGRNNGCRAAVPG
jgi:hypothetical protein